MPPEGVCAVPSGRQAKHREMGEFEDRALGGEPTWPGSQTEGPRHHPSGQCLRQEGKSPEARQEQSSGLTRDLEQIKLDLKGQKKRRVTLRVP